MKAIAIDGPAGAGKSTIAKLVANRLKLVYIDTGAMYRAVAFYFISNNMDFTNIAIVKQNLNNINIDIKHSNNTQLIYLNNVEITNDIRTEQLSSVASSVATILEVREKLLIMQREMASKTDVAMDGRDIGTCVLPYAQLKIFLAAAVEERANRRYNQLLRRGKQVDYNQILLDLKERDRQDTNREIAPLKQANDAVLIDSTHMSINQVVNYIVKLAKERGF